MKKSHLIEYLKNKVSKISVFSNEAYSHIAIVSQPVMFRGIISGKTDNIRLEGKFSYTAAVKSMFFGALAVLVCLNAFLVYKTGFEKAMPYFAAVYILAAIIAGVADMFRKKQEKALMQTLSEKAFRVDFTNKNGIDSLIKPTWMALFGGENVCITEKEREMYENGEMAPMAYTYLMKLTYYWFLADTDEERERCRGFAESFRQNGYKTTCGCFPKVDEGIEFMPAKPVGELTEEEHYFRNRLTIQFSWDLFSKLQARLPDELKWSKLGFFNSLFHKFDFRGKKYEAQGNNRKYVSACGHFEIVFTKENHLLNVRLHNAYMGTYNFYTYKNPGEHKRFDVIPWSLWGTVDEDEDIGI